METMRFDAVSREAVGQRRIPVITASPPFTDDRSEPPPRQPLRAEDGSPSIKRNLEDERRRI